MITIALDEGGHFEQQELDKQNKNKCMFIGGLVFYYTDDCSKELKRIQNYLKNTCLSKNLKYPEDLHFNRIDGQIINRESAEIIKI